MAAGELPNPERGHAMKPNARQKSEDMAGTS